MDFKELTRRKEELDADINRTIIESEVVIRNIEASMVIIKQRAKENIEKLMLLLH